MGFVPVLAGTVGERLISAVFLVAGILVLVGHHRIVRAFEAQQRAFYDALGVKFLKRVNDWMLESRVVRAYSHVFLYVWGVGAVVLGGYGVIFGLD